MILDDILVRRIVYSGGIYPEKYSTYIIYCNGSMQGNSFLCKIFSDPWMD